jgi:hypothetical protein
MATAAGLVVDGRVKVPAPFTDGAPRWVLIDQWNAGLRAIRQSGSDRRHYNLITDQREKFLPREAKRLATIQAKKALNIGPRWQRAGP